MSRFRVSGRAAGHALDKRSEDKLNVEAATPLGIGQYPIVSSCFSDSVLQMTMSSTSTGSFTKRERRHSCHLFISTTSMSAN